MIGMKRTINGKMYWATGTTYNGGDGVTKWAAEREARNIRASGYTCRIIKSVDPMDRRMVGYVVFMPAY